MSDHGLPPWGVKLILRLLQLRAPGAYSLMFIVESDGARKLIVLEQPRRLEVLGGEIHDNSHSDYEGMPAARQP